jgi:uncharacterized RDD family membrane protein YckC
MSQVSVSTPFNIHLDFEIAPFHRRLLAWFIDLAVLLVFARGMKFFVSDALPSESRIGVDIILVSIPMLLYHLVMEVVFQGQSLGKKAMGIRVISIEGGEPGLGQYLMRWMFRLWEWPLVFGFVAMESYGIIIQLLVTGILGIIVVIIIAVTNNSQRLGDLAAGTAVVDIRYQYSLSDTVFRDIAIPNYTVSYPEVMRLSDRDINAIRAVILQTQKSNRYDTALRVAAKVKEVLKIESNMEVIDFLEKLLEDYNYLATRES